MQSEVRHIIFNSADRKDWLKKISQLYDEYATLSEGQRVVMTWGNEINKSQIEPLHLVTLACLIQHLSDNGYSVSMSKANIEMINYIYQDLNYSAYWKGGLNHVEPKTSGSIFNLWRIVESEKDLYAKKVEEYFNRNYFENKDLSALNVSLVEAFYNVFDHAGAKENAFVLLQYQEKEHRLLAAVADFGIGIGQSVRNYNPEITNDLDAISWAVRDHSTVQSTSHNKGLGLGNILSVATEARIFSGDALLKKKDNEEIFFKINFKFPGTLIYLTIDMSGFDDVEIYETFNW